MEDIPYEIKEKFDAIKLDYPFNIYLRKVNGHYYIYRQLSKAEYLGRIGDNGKFIKKSLSNLEDYSQTKIDSLADLDEKDFRILKALSMNALMSLQHMSEIVDMPITTLEGRIKGLEDKLGISYIAEIDVEKLGYIKYLVYVKFKGGIPGENELRSVFAKEPRIQLALMTFSTT